MKLPALDMFDNEVLVNDCIKLMTQFIKLLIVSCSVLPTSCEDGKG